MKSLRKVRCCTGGAVVLTLLLLSACSTTHKIDTTHKVQLEVKPMHITIDVNLKVDRELDDFFSDIDKQDPTKTKTQENEK